jgi:hypothetical protein
MRRGLDGFTFFWPACSFQASSGPPVPHDFGGHSEGETPLPIPNRAVKPLSADGTWWATAWESRSPPVLSKSRPSGRLFFVPEPDGEWRRRVERATPRSGPPRRGSSRGLAGCRGSATRDAGRRCAHPAAAERRPRRGSSMSHRRCGGPSPAPPIRAGDRVWDAGRSVGERTPPRGSRGHTRQAWRSRVRGRHRRRLAGQGRCARGTWPADYGRPRTEHMFCKGCCRGPRRRP